MIDNNFYIKILLFIIIFWTSYNGYSLSEQKKIFDQNFKIKNYYINNTKSSIFNKNGMLNYELISKKINFLPKNKIYFFKKLILTHYDKNIKPDWMIYSDKAFKNNHCTIYLYGNVFFRSLKINSNLNYIKTNSAKFNFCNQNIDSKDQVMIYGSNFFSTGKNMHSNLLNKNIKIMNMVHTYYDMQYKKK